MNPLPSFDGEVDQEPAASEEVWAALLTDALRRQARRAVQAAWRHAQDEAGAAQERADALLRKLNEEAGDAE